MLLHTCGQLEDLRTNENVLTGPVKELVSTNSIHHPTGIDVDVTTGNIYWTDHSISTIFVTE